MGVGIHLNNVGVDFIVHKGAVKAARDASETDSDDAVGARFQKVGRRYVASALNGITMKIRPGDQVGLAGHNGSGKSTLLRVLSGSLEPTRGSVTVTGRIATMMSTTFGFNMQQTGRENILRRGLMMRMTHKEIKAKTVEIVEFAELGAYIDLPMSTYSAGMRTRLGFAITTAVDADIVIMDEWIGAGDARFAERAQERLTQTISRSQILILATHNEGLMRRTCNKTVILDKGEVLAAGDVDIIGEYSHYLRQRTAAPVQ